MCYAEFNQRSIGSFLSPKEHARLGVLADTLENNPYLLDLIIEWLELIFQFDLGYSKDQLLCAKANHDIAGYNMVLPVWENLPEFDLTKRLALLTCIAEADNMLAVDLRPYVEAIDNQAKLIARMILAWQGE